MIKLSEEISLDDFDCTSDLIDVIVDFAEVRGYYVIDWVDVMDILRSFSKMSKDKFNIYPETIDSMDDLIELRSTVYDAVRGKKPLIRRVCMDCGKEFYIFLSEKNFFEHNKMNLPKRCKDCRKKKRDRMKEKQGEAHEQ